MIADPHRIVFSELGRPDDTLFLTVEDVLARARRKGATVGAFTPPVRAESFGEIVEWSAAKWWRKGGSEERYAGKIVLYRTIGRAK